ncbi:hypothetical protein AZI87_11975 [Bdellovibrio bacteriovorus]|uniref:Uncharacterized protein n=1 Tax=Bdellovibrio bacteriovorus TaxID=959 RepID=A0A161PBY3_BDEBC|nr:hypothetical protein [Bdellovibrio bacteriovorus]KYG65266.1 hypothetical protein AZI87_11975 [Bdellovibrio bacteriovorus]
MATDLELGKQALKYFHNRSTRYSAYGNRTYEELYAVYGKKADIYADGIGLAISANNMSQGDVIKAMEGLADVAQGRIPKDHQEYIKALGNKASQINYLDLTTTVAKDVGTTVLDGTVTFGNSVITSMSWLTSLLPFLLIGGVIFYIYSFGKNNSTVSKETMDSIKKKVKEGTAAVKARVKKATK